MKTTFFFTAILMTVAMSASAQLQLFDGDRGHGAICRKHNLFMMEAGDNPLPIWNITNYKKNGNKETFTLTPKENTKVTYSCEMTLTNDFPSAITLTSETGGKLNLTLKKIYEESLYKYYTQHCGRASTTSVEGCTTGTASVPSVKEGGVEGAAKSVGDGAKKAFGKVNGLFSKKKSN